jgi:Fe2+ or Zn2+ uptake regulation protein
MRQRGVRPTRQREVVYAALAATDAHPTAEELHELVRRIEPTLSLATVYNTLEALTEAGLCQKLPPMGHASAWRYDADTSEHVHATTPEGHWVDLPHDLSDRLLASLDQESINAIEALTGARVLRIAVQLTIEPAPGSSPTTPSPKA